MSMYTLIAQANSANSGLVIGGVLLGAAIAFILLVVKCMVVGNPSELLVISGRKADGNGYRTLIGGRTVVIPLLEKVSRLSLRNMQVALEVTAQSGGGNMIPVAVTGVANVKVSSEPAMRGNAIERFLDQPVAELQRVARETLEGGLRAVIGKMTPEEIVEDRDKFVATVMNEVTDDFRKLGMVIDSVNIQNVHDEGEYLDSIARKASAKVRAEARQYEAERKSEAEIKEAQAQSFSRQAQAERDSEARATEAVSRQKAEQARLSAEQAIAESETALRIRKADLDRDAAGQEKLMQLAMAEAEEARLQASDVKAAQAARDVSKAAAEGQAASILEEGKARATAIESIGQAIQRHPEALKVMLAEMLPDVVRQLSNSVSSVELGEITVIDGGHGEAISGAAMSRVRMLRDSVAAVESVLGIDLQELTKSIAGRVSSGSTTNGSDTAAAQIKG